MYSPKENKTINPNDPKFLAENHVNSASIHVVKTHHLSRAKCNKMCENLAASLIEKCKHRKINLKYDISYGGYPNHLRYAEFFAGLGGIQILPCSGDLICLLYRRAYDTVNNVDFSTYLGPETYDKYLVHDYDIFPMRGLVILPGSNLLTDLVNKEKLNSAVLLGAKIKPHPLTNQNDINKLRDEYGDDVVMPKLYSGYKAMFNANVLYATGSTELALYAMLLGKQVIDIGTGVFRGGYMDAFSHVIDSPNQKETLNELLNNPASGIIMREDQIDTYLDIYDEMLDYYMTEDMLVPNLRKHKVV